MENSQMNSKVKIGLKSFLAVVGILFAVVILVGILTYVIPAGQYQLDPETGKIIPNTYQVIDSTTRLPVYRWFTASIEALIFGKNNMNIIQIIALLLILGGTFKVLDNSGGLVALVRLVVNRFYKHRYVTIWIITLLIMILSSCFGLQEQLLILFPVFIMLAKAMNWSKVQAISLILITSGVGFTTALFNHFTVGTATSLAGVNILDNIWFRLIIFVIMYVITSLYLVYRAKQDEKKSTEKFDLESFTKITEEEYREDKRKATMITILFSVALFVLILSNSLPIKGLASLSMIIMGAAFIIGTIIIGRILLGSFKELGKSFVSGMVDVLPSILIVLIAFSVTYIADRGNILHTIFYYFSNLVSETSPYVSVMLLYIFILIIEFFIPSASAKATLIIPLLTLGNIPGISVGVIILTYLFADGYTNVLFPTCGTLVIGLGLANVSYLEWFKKTILFQVLLMIVSMGFLFIAIAIGI